MEKGDMGRVSTGVEGLDEILMGGLLPGRSYVVRGGPGTGKTTLGLHFLATGAALGEASLFISLDESEQSLRENATRLDIPCRKRYFSRHEPVIPIFRRGAVLRYFRTG